MSELEDKARELVGAFRKAIADVPTDEYGEPTDYPKYDSIRADYEADALTLLLDTAEEQA